MSAHKRQLSSIGPGMSEAVTNGKVAGRASFSMASKPPSLDVSQAFRCNGEISSARKLVLCRTTTCEESRKRPFFKTNFLHLCRTSPFYDANLSRRTKGLVLPVWTTSAICDLPKFSRLQSITYCCSKVIMSGVNSNVIMSGYGDDNPDGSVAVAEPQSALK